MSDLVYELEYQPTTKELIRGGRLLHKILFKGVWRLAYWLKMVVAALSAFVFGLIVVMIAYQQLDIAVSDAPLAYYAMAGLISSGVLIVMTKISRRSALMYFEKLQSSNLKVRISVQGIEYFSPKWRHFSSGSNTDEAREKNDVIVFSIGSSGFILSDRMLCSLGEPAAIRSQVFKWHHQANGKASK